MAQTNPIYKVIYQKSSFSASHTVDAVESFVEEFGIKNIFCYQLKEIILQDHMVPQLPLHLLLQPLLLQQVLKNSWLS